VPSRLLAILAGVAATIAVAAAQVRPSPLAAPASERLERLSSEQGLSHNSVYAILQDSRGFLWFGTQDGLDRYDGVEFVSYRHAPGDLGSLASSWVRALHEDREGRLWVGTREGLHRMRPSGSGFDRVALENGIGSQHPPVLSLAEDGEGRVWAGTPDGLFRVAADDGTTFVEHDPDDASSPGAGVVHAVRAGADGAIWVLTGGAAGFALNRHTGGGFERFVVPPTLATAFDSSGDLIGPNGSVPVGELAARAHELRFDPLPTAILADSRGRIWIGTHEGLFARGGDAPLERVRTDHLRAGALAGEVNAIFEDRTGTVWIGTFAGALRLDPNRKTFGRIEHVPGDATSLSADAVSAVLQDLSGRLWVGTYGAGLDEIDPETGRVRHYRSAAGDSPAICGDYIWDLAVSPSPSAGVWVTTVSGLCRVVAGGRVEHHRLVPVCRNALTLAEDATGALWLGTHAGLCRYEPGTGASSLAVPAERAQLSPVDALHIDEAGRIWMGSAGGGQASLASLDPAGGLVTPYPDATDAAVWDNSSLAPVSGFLTSTIQFQSGASPAELGQTLQIRLRLIGSQVGQVAQVNFDNVRLDATLVDASVPEPTTLLLLGSGLAAAGLRRRKTRSADRRV